MKYFKYKQEVKDVLIYNYLITEFSISILKIMYETCKPFPDLYQYLTKTTDQENTEYTWNLLK